MSLPVYLAGPSHNLPRVKRLARALDALGTVEIVEPWWRHFERYRTDAEVPFRVRQDVARSNLDGIARARLVWLLWPAMSGGSTGTAVEFGYALRLREADGRAIMITGGDPSRSLFTSLADLVFELDEQGLEAAERMAREVRP